MLTALRDAHLEIVAFDGPGQGAAREAGIPMTADWHCPVAAVLDRCALDDVTLLGFSLGRCLVMRAPPASRASAESSPMTSSPSSNACYIRPLTGAEHAHNHCQVGGLGLALKVILNWLDNHAGRTSISNSRETQPAAAATSVIHRTAAFIDLRCCRKPAGRSPRSTRPPRSRSPSGAGPGRRHHRAHT
jgi:hypothetical protein